MTHPAFRHLRDAAITLESYSLEKRKSGETMTKKQIASEKAAYNAIIKAMNALPKIIAI